MVNDLIREIGRVSRFQTKVGTSSAYVWSLKELEMFGRVADPDKPGSPR